MKATLKDGNVSIDIHALVESLTDEDRELFAKYAVFSESLFTGVVNTLVTGVAWDDGWWMTGLDQKLRVKLMPLMPQIVQELVSGLLEENARRISAIKKHEDVLSRLLRAWPREVKCPQEDSYVHQDCLTFTQADAEAYLVKRLGDEWEAIKARSATDEEPSQCRGSTSHF
jgi:hypothetical protein